MRNASVAIAFFLGACTTVTVQSAMGTATPVTENAPTGSGESGESSHSGHAGATVVALNEAELRTAPSGKALVRFLARGHNAFLGRLEMEGGSRVPEHRDATEEYIHVLEGSGTLTIEGHAHQLSPGSTVFMPANARVEFQNGPEPMVAIQVFAGPEPAAKYDTWEAGAP